MDGEGIENKQPARQPEANRSSNKAIPERVGPYRVEARLGVGGMGQVYRAFDERLQRPVAIKQILQDENADARARERLRREARAVASLNHPAVVQIHDILEADEGDWIVMELVEGRTLQELSNDGSLAMRDVVRLGREIADGLVQAHGKGIVHRDLKTENVMVTPGGQAKILDFGLAKRLWHHRKNEVSLSVQGSLMGTGRAMSPEQVLGDEVDHRSDLFSLGTLLYETVTGRRPFAGMSLIMTLAQVCTEQQEPAHEVNSDVPRELSDLIEHLLEKEPEDRPTSAREVVETLDRIAATMPDTESIRAPSAQTAAQGSQSVSDLRRHLKAATRAAEKPPAEPTAGIFVKTLLQLSLLDARSLSEVLGSTEAYEVLSRHDQLVRNLLMRYDGLEVNKSDGFLLLFHRAIDALRFALGYFEELARLSFEQETDFEARVGIHLGEVFLRENAPEEVSRGARPLEVDGDTKEIVTRMIHLAQGGQILFTHSAYEMARRAMSEAGASGSWVDHGEYSLSGLDEQIRLHELTRRVDGKGRAPMRTPHAKKVGAGTGGWKDPRRLAVVLLLLLIPFGVWIDDRLRKPNPNPSDLPSTGGVPVDEASDRPTIAILGFKNVTSDPETEWLSTALVEMLHTELTASDDVEMIPGENVARVKLEISIESVESLAADTLERLGRFLGARYVILGSYLSLGPSSDRRLRLTLHVQDTQTGETVAVIPEIGAEIDLFDLVSQSSSKLREELGIGAISNDEAAAFRATVSENPEALRLYSEGLDRLQRFDALGATASLEEAIQEDPDYALAYAALSQAWRLVGYENSAQEAARRAIALSEGLPRDTVLKIEAISHEARSDWQEAIKTYEVLWGYTNRPEYGLLLAEAQIEARRGEEALETISKLRELSEETFYLDLRLEIAEAQGLRLRGDHQSAVEAARRAVSKGREQNLPILVAEAQRLEAQSHFFLGRFTEALPLLEEAIELFSTVRLSSRIAMASGNMAEIRFDQRQYEEAIEDYRVQIEQNRTLGNIAVIAGYQRRVAMIYLAIGRLSDAEREIEEALAIARETGSRVREVRCLETQAFVRLRQGRLQDAESVALQVVDMERDSQGPNRAYRLSWAYLALSNLADLRGDLEASQAYLELSATAAETIEQALIETKLELRYAVGATFSAWMRDDREGVSGHVERFRELAAQMGRRTEPVLEQFVLIRALTAFGETDLAAELVDPWIEEMQAAGAADAERLLSAAAVELELTRGRFEAAKERWKTISETAQDPWVRGVLGTIEARISAEEGRFGEAERLLTRVVREAEEAEFAVVALEANLYRARLLVRRDEESGRAAADAVRDEAERLGLAYFARAIEF